MTSVARFRIPGHVGFCNALRRTLISDLETEAPTSVRMIKNVTCHTDEYIAHRIGLIPFRRIGNGDTLTLNARGPCTVTCADLSGPAFESIHNNLEILYLNTGHELHMEITFTVGRASSHARYSPCYAVGMIPDGHDAHIVSFGSNDHREPHQLLLDSFQHLDARIDRALLLLANETDACESYI